MEDSTKKRKQNINILLKIFQWLPLYATLSILPFIVHYKLYLSRLYGTPYYTDDIYNYDFNLYYKQLIFLIIAGFAAVILAVLLYKNRHHLKHKLRKQLSIAVTMGIYILFAFLSSVCSDYRHGAFTGSDGQFQSFFALLAYIIIAVYLVFLVKTEQDVKQAGIAFLIGVFLQTLLGILQFFGFDLYNYTWYQKLITPAGYLEAVGPVTNTMPDMLSLCLNNPNYAGVLMALFAALCFGILLTERRLWYGVAEAVLLVAVLVTLVGTGSETGLFVFVVCAIIGIIFWLTKFGKYGKYIMPIGIISVILSVVAVSIAKPTLVKDIKNSLGIQKEEANPLSRMVTSSHGVEINYHDVEFVVGVDTSGEYLKPLLSLADGTKIPAVLSKETNRYYANHNILGNGVVSFQVGVIDQLPAVSVHMNSRDWLFVSAGVSGYYYINPYGHMEKLEEIERWGFEGYERLATNRGLLWSMTLPLLKETFFLGAGANNFIHIFPQNNYKDIFYYYNQMVTNTKPHNMYLQIATETGVISLLALLVFWGYYLVQSAKLYWNCSFDTLSKRLGFGCALAVLVYLGCGITNDSMISVAPIFWCVQGIGLAVNFMNKIE